MTDSKQVEGVHVCRARLAEKMLDAAVSCSPVTLQNGPRIGQIRLGAPSTSGTAGVSSDQGQALIWCAPSAVKRKSVSPCHCRSSLRPTACPEWWRSSTPVTVRAEEEAPASVVSGVHTAAHAACMHESSCLSHAD